MLLQLGIQDQELKLYIMYINDDPRLTLAYFTAMSNLVAYTFERGKAVTQSLFKMGITYSKGLN